MSFRRQVLSVPSQKPAVPQLSLFHPFLDSSALPPPPPPLHAVFIVTFIRGTASAQERAKPYHWVFLIQAYKDARKLHPGIVHQLHGAPGNFHYRGDESAYVLKNLDQAINKIEVGSVEASKLCRVAEVLHRVPIVDDPGSRWNSQDWSCRGLELLRFLEVVGDGHG